MLPWSPDGTEIAFAAAVGEVPGLLRVRPRSRPGPGRRSLVIGSLETSSDIVLFTRDR